MLKQPLEAPQQGDGPGSVGSTDPPPARADVVTVRNSDHAAGHSVRVTVSDGAGQIELTERCYLAPGQSRRLTTAIDPAEYRITVRVDGVERTTTACPIDGSRARTAVIEIGNGFVSVTQGPGDLITA